MGAGAPCSPHPITFRSTSVAVRSGAALEVHVTSGVKKSPAELLPRYRENLAKYEREGNDERVRIQRLLIARLEKDCLE